MRVLDIKLDAYFPFNFRLLGLVLYVGVPLVVIAKGFGPVAILVDIILILLGTILLTTRYGVEVNSQDKTYKEYTWLLGKHIGNSQHFNHIAKFYINQVNDQAEFTSRAGIRYDIKQTVFKAFMKLDDGSKIHIGTHKNEDKLSRLVESYKSQLKNVFKPEE